MTTKRSEKSCKVGRQVTRQATRREYEAVRRKFKTAKAKRKGTRSLDVPPPIDMPPYGDPCTRKAFEQAVWWLLLVDLDAQLQASIPVYLDVREEFQDCLDGLNT